MQSRNEPWCSHNQHQQQSQQQLQHQSEGFQPKINRSQQWILGPVWDMDKPQRPPGRPQQPPSRPPGRPVGYKNLFANLQLLLTKTTNDSSLLKTLFCLKHENISRKMNPSRIGRLHRRRKEPEDYGD